MSSNIDDITSLKKIPSFYIPKKSLDLTRKKTYMTNDKKDFSKDRRS